MPRTNLARQTPPGAYADTGALLAFTAADTVNLNEASIGDGVILLARNSSGGALTVTVTSQPDAFGRTNDIAAYSIPAGETHVFGPFVRAGWAATGAKLHFQASGAGILFAALGVRA